MQIRLWQGSQEAKQLPEEFIDLILGVEERQTSGRDSRGNICGSLTRRKGFLFIGQMKGLLS